MPRQTLAIIFVFCGATLTVAAGLDARVATAAEPEAKPAAKYSLRDTVRGRVVDERGNPLADVIVSDYRARLWGKVNDVVTDSDGNFRIAGRPGYWRRGTLIARSRNGELQSYVEVEEAHALPRRLEIVLKPAQKVLVTVVDDADKPVPSATVEVIGNYASVATGTTDDSGRAELLFPADVKVDWVLAFKDNIGFDYYENYIAYPTADRGVVPEQLPLRLDGARPRVVAEAKTHDGKPVAGIAVAVWVIKKPGKVARANVGGSYTTRRTTDADGKAYFDFLPTNGSEGISFLAHSDDYHSTEGLHIGPGGDDLLPITLKPNGAIRGRLTFADGSPAPQILLQAEGNGSPHYFRGFARSDDEGNYSFSVYADQTYTINVLDDDWAAASRTGERVNLGDKPHEVNFALIPGTLIEGALSIGPDNAPSVGATATLTQEPQFVRWSTTDQRGHYKFRVGPGTYKLLFPHGMEPHEVAVRVTDQASIVHDAHALRKDRDQLRGDVRRASDNAPVPGALIFAESIGSPGHAGFHAVADAAGRFKTERWLDRIFVVARDPFGNQAGMTVISEDDQLCELKVAPAARLVGRVVDEQGQPISKARVQCATWLPNALQPPRDENDKAPRLDTTVYCTGDTAPDGTFSFPALPVGAKSGVYISWKDRSEGWKTFEITEPQEISTGDIVLKPPKADAPK